MSGVEMNRVEASDDAALLEAWRAGDEKAGNQLFQRHFSAIYRFFRSKLDDDVEDMVQQTFLTCARNRDAFRGDSSFRTYLFQVAKSRLYDALRKRTRSGTPVALSTMADLRSSPSTWVARGQDLRLLQGGLERLPLELQLAVELFYFEDQSASQVAQILDIPEGTVRSRVRRAVEQLRAFLEEASAAPSVRRTLEGLDELLATE
ncbi:MAG: RNA polymerase sigma factor [Polyangiaceae bacterium]|nr:RNA polymerase sigma factor [Polyangiaceae bacterium]